MLRTQSAILFSSAGAERINWNDGDPVVIADLLSPGPGVSTATLRVKADGTVWSICLNTGDTELFNWLLSGANTDYQIKVDTTSGAIDSGVTGTWLDMTADLDWTETRAIAGSESAGFTVSIRDKITTAVLVTVTLNSLTCEIS